MSGYGLPSLGSATGTRVDSAAKHIMACKVDSRLLAAWLPDRSQDAASMMHNHKLTYCMHKDEIVLNTGKKADGQSDTTVKAYPMVVTTVGDMHAKTQELLRILYRQHSASDFFLVQSHMHPNSNYDLNAMLNIAPVAEPEKIMPVLAQIKSLPDFHCQGVALGQAWASYMSGDTVASVLVGGMATVQNGHFAMHTGDLVQWYFDFEAGEFEEGNRPEHGRRLLPRAAPVGGAALLMINAIAPGAAAHNVGGVKRKDYMDERLYGSSGSMGRAVGMKKPGTVARIKSYKMRNFTLPAAGGPHAPNAQTILGDHYGDKTRVFAKCISGGRPFDQVDIMLMTQSL